MSQMRSVAGILFLVTLSSTVQADPVRVDQAVIPTDASHASIFGDIVQAQTFTVGVTGTLTALDLFLTRNSFLTGPLFVDIRPTVDGVPVLSHDSALASFSVSPTAVAIVTPPGPAFRVDLFDFALSVRAGDLLAFALRSPESSRATGEYSAAAVPTDVYKRGELFTFSPSSGMHEMTRIPNFDLAFTTYVDPAPVPEPGTLLLVAAGAVGIARAVRKRRVRQL